MARLHGSGQNKPRLLVGTQTQRRSPVQMRRHRHALPYALVSLQYRARRRPAGRPPLEPFFFHGSGGSVILYGRQRRISGGLRANDAALFLHSFEYLCRPLRVSLFEARVTASNIPPPPPPPALI